MKKTILFTIVSICVVFISKSQGLENDILYNIGLGFNGYVKTSALQSDGKLIVAGNFTSFNGVTRNRIARLNTDGTLDLTFDPLVGFSTMVNSIAIQNDGKIIAGGAFNSYNGTIRYSVARINPDGTLDLTFNSTGTGLNSYVNTVVIQPSDGKIIVGGYFTSYNGTSMNRIVRLNTDGSLDLAFNPGTGFDNEVHTIRLNATEAIVVAGRFSAYNGTSRYGVAQINSNGTLDTSFNPNAAMGAPIDCYALAIQTDGKILVSTIPYGSNVYRFNPNGSSDGSFSTGGTFGGVITSLTIQPDGKILVGGEFNKGLRRINTNGSNDFSVLGTGFGVYPFTVFATAIQSDGKIIVGGLFFDYDNSMSRNNIARLTTCGSVVINSQPNNITVCEAENTSFNIAVTGTNLNYQWQVDQNTGTFSNLSNGGVYSGVTTPTLSLTGVTIGLNNYKYRCIINDGACQTTSNSRTLTVNLAQVITANPTNNSVCENGNITFTASVSGPLSNFQWQENQGSGFVNLTNGGIYSGVNTLTLTLSNVPLSMNSYVYRLVASACSPTISNSATLTVVDIPVITSQPISSIEFCTSNTGDIAMNLTASGSGSLTYQWQGYIGSSNYTNLSNGSVAASTFIAGGNYSGVNSDSLSISTPTPNTAYTSDPSLYRCIVSNGTCAVNSSLVFVHFYSTPSISTHPTDVTKCAGSSGNVTFGVTLTSTPSGVSYQWQEDAGSGFMDITNGGTYSGATSSTLTLASAGINASMNNFKYRCVIGNCFPAVVSFDATLYVDEMPVIITAPQSLTICDGMDANFTINVNGNNLTYQWQEQITCCTYNNISNGGIYSGADTDELIISPTTIGMNAYRYRCIVSSGTCSYTSNNVPLNVRSIPTFTNHPTNSNICEGMNTTFSTNATNAFGTYQWQVDQFGLGIYANITDNTVYSGSNSNFLSITGATPMMDGYVYRCVAGSCLPEATSNTAILTVNSIPSISAHPIDQSICSGDNALFYIASLGVGTHNYQWQSDLGNIGNWVNITNNSVYSGVADDTLTLTIPPSNFHNYNYRCVVSSGTNCSSSSNEGLLEVTSLITGLSQVTPSNLDPTVIFGINNMPSSVTNWYWDFGDGTTLSGNTAPTYTYSSNGMFNACLIGINSCDSVAHCFNLNIMNVVGIEENTLSNIKLAPNPTKEYVQFTNIDMPIEVKIYNTIGKLIYTTQINSVHYTLNISEFENGIYIFELNGIEKKYFSKRIKIIKSD